LTRGEKTLRKPAGSACSWSDPISPLVTSLKELVSIMLSTWVFDLGRHHFQRKRICRRVCIRRGPRGTEFKSVNNFVFFAIDQFHGIGAASVGDDETVRVNVDKPS